MKRFLLGLAIAVLISVGSFVGPKAQTAFADHNRWLPAMPTATQLRVLERGYGTYCFNSTAAAYPNFRSQARQVYDDEETRIGIPWVEVAPGPGCDIQHMMVTQAQFPCGAGAAACIYYANDPVTVYYLRDLLYSDWKSTIGHEHGHWDGEHERYFDSNGRLVCDTTATYTRMSCGTGVWWVTDYDRDVVWNVLVPDKPFSMGLRVNGNNTATVYWDKYRADCLGQPNFEVYSTNFFGPAHMDCKNDVASRVTFAWSPYLGGPITWAGDFCGPQYNYCYANYDWYGYTFDAAWRGCLYLRAENNRLWWVSQQSAPDYWVLAGCW